MSKTGFIRRLARRYKRKVASGAGALVGNYALKKMRYATKFKGRGATTRTRTKRKRRSGSYSNAESVSSSGGRIILNKKRPKNCSSTTMLYRQNGVANYESFAGQQRAVTIVGANTKNQWVVSNGDGYNNQYQNYTRLFDMNPNMTTTGSSYFSAQTALIQNDRLICKSIDIEIELTNFSNIGGYLTIYYVTPRRLTDEFPEDTWTDGFGAQAMGKSPHADVAPGSLQAKTGGVRITDVGATPNQSKKFKEMWRVCAVKSFSLAAGATIKSKMNVLVNKLVKQEVLEADTGTVNSFIPKLTVMALAVWRGQVVLDKSETVKLPTYGIVNVGFISNTTYRLGYVNGNAARFDTSISTYQVPQATLEANLETMNAFEGIAQAYEDVTH